ncbi:hypothetical protein L873DRAFT_1836174 [Choiromyces venosus 120613-1]|uniref:SRR1-like domain-containing protein n=1 Tax=Choiromyces venosus 120613-1 TaxID=1336337 RepID=A0A3N4JNH4_9PEZI|nr:hypothetical protein L873DRAFT_1836174 [Choiromyces venosus 120613-1]
MPRRPRQTTSDDGWTNIPAKHRPPKTLPEHQKRASIAHALQHQDTSPLTPEQITSRLTPHTQTLLSSPLWTQIHNVLVPLARGLNRLVVFGLGSFSGHTASSTYYQFALVREMARLLGIGVEGVYFQDPAFTKSDRVFLEGVGSVVEVGRGEEVVREGTVVVAVHLEYEVLEGAVVGRPGVVVCNDLGHFLDMRIGGEVEWVKAFLEGVEGEVLKWDVGGGGAFNHSAVYWRKGKKAEDHGEKSEGDKVDVGNGVEGVVEKISAINI